MNELAARAGIGNRTVGRLLNGTTRPTPETLAAIAGAMSVHVGVLFKLAYTVNES